MLSSQTLGRYPLMSLGVLLSLPVSHMSSDDSRRLLWTMLPPKSLDKIALGIHQIKINTVIDKIVLALLDTLGCREIYPVAFAYLLDLLPSTCEANDIGMEFIEVAA